MLERRALRRHLLPGITSFAEGGNFGPTWPEVKPMETASRELTRDERAAIRKLVMDMCANYDLKYGCLPLDCPCYMLGKCWTGAYCKYFQNAVLPLNSVLEAALMGKNDVLSPKICPVCGAAYIPVTNQAYCSEACRAVGQHEADRRRQRRHRQNNGDKVSRS
jgi:predicted nucleic acid-binding Zn ribbon protein